MALPEGNVNSDDTVEPRTALPEGSAGIEAVVNLLDHLLDACERSIGAKLAPSSTAISSVAKIGLDRKSLVCSKFTTAPPEEDADSVETAFPGGSADVEVIIENCLLALVVGAGLGDVGGRTVVVVGRCSSS